MSNITQSSAEESTETNAAAQNNRGGSLVDDPSSKISQVRQNQLFDIV